MTGHENRKTQKMDKIKKATIDLCNKYGIQKVTIDEIAQHASVSKVTIYKYFNSKDELISTTINEIYNSIIETTRDLVIGEGDFIEKLNIVMKSKVEALNIFNGDFLEELFLKPDSEPLASFNEQIKEIMLEFFETGKEQGYIDEQVEIETIYAYSELFIYGLQNMLSANPGLLSDTEKTAKLIRLFFYGFINTHQNNVN